MEEVKNLSNSEWYITRGFVDEQQRARNLKFKAINSKTVDLVQVNKPQCHGEKKNHNNRKKQLAQPSDKFSI